jgi:alkylresorcinol/alkylpyrone synthase
MTRIAAAVGVLPQHRYAQADLTAAFADLVLGADRERRPLLERVHTSAGVRYRSLALPLEAYPSLRGFGAANDRFLEVGADLGWRAVDEALRRSGVSGADVDVILCTSVTGVGAPSLDARLAPRLGLRPDVKRLPIFGLGCVAGAAGIARLHDHLVGHPDDVAVLLSVELCSLTLQPDDASPANLVASGLFGDGAAAVVLLGERRAEQLALSGAPRVVDTRSRLYAGTEHVMGWQIGGSGFRIVLDASVADVVEAHLGDDVRLLLAEHDLKTVDVGAWVAHPGGPKVLTAVQRALELRDGALDVTWECLREAGNLSSASVLHVLERTLARGVTPGTPGLLLAMGPGFCAELVLLEW